MPFTYALINDPDSSPIRKKWAAEWNQKMGINPPNITPNMRSSVIINGVASSNQTALVYNEYHNFVIQVASEVRNGEWGLTWYGYKRFDQVFGFGLEKIPDPKSGDGVIKILKMYPSPEVIKMMPNINYHQLLEEIKEAMLVREKSESLHLRITNRTNQVIFAEEIL